MAPRDLQSRQACHVAALVWSEGGVSEQTLGVNECLG